MLLLTNGSCNQDLKKKPDDSQAYHDPEPWPGGIVYYCFQGNFTESIKLLFKRAMSSWDSTTPVSFIESPCGSGVYEINLKSGSIYTIYSTLGYNPGNANYMHIFTPDAIGFQSVAHEFGHCLGLIHEHQRPDRDKYVRILWDNIDNNCRNQFEAHDNPLYIEENFHYDYESIMGYDQFACTPNNSLPNIQALDDDWKYNIGPSSWYPTENDREKIRAIYDPEYEYDDKNITHHSDDDMGEDHDDDMLYYEKDIYMINEIPE